MPWKIEKQGSRYCVRKIGGSVVPGGCHASLDEALKHQRALYANEGRTASMAPLVPSRSVFEIPEADAPTPITYADDGTVYGHLALWETCHVGLASGAMSECVKPPRSVTDYRHFHLGEIETLEGERVAVGKIVLATGHASTTADLSAATRHYDDTGSVGAFVRARNGRHGIWVSGVLRSDLTPEQVRDLRANSVSGDWRLADHNLELVAALAVPVPGFPIPRAQLSLAASGEISTLILTEPVEPAFTARQWKQIADTRRRIVAAACPEWPS